MKLKPFVPNSRNLIVNKLVTIQKSGIISFTTLTQEEFKITLENSIELIFDEDEASNGGVKHIYMLIKKKDDPTGYNVTKLGDQEGKNVTINGINFLKSVKYKVGEEKKSFVPELRRIGTIDYLLIDLEKPIGTIEDKGTEEN